MATSKQDSNAQGHAQVRAYVRKLLALGGQPGVGGGMGGAKLALPKPFTTSVSSAAPHALPRQLEAMAFTTTSRKRSNSGGGGTGNAWLLSPLSSTVKSLFSLFGDGAASQESTRYRARSRTPFQIVESFSPETGSGTSGARESSAALTGFNPVAGGKGVSSGNVTNVLLDNRQALVTALRRGLSESRGIADVLSEFQDGL